jgi:hypothetical protein
MQVPTLAPKIKVFRFQVIRFTARVITIPCKAELLWMRPVKGPIIDHTVGFSKPYHKS